MVKCVPGPKGSCIHVFACVLTGLFILCTFAFTPAALFTNFWACEGLVKIQYHRYAYEWSECKGVQGTALVFVYIGFAFIFFPVKCVCCILLSCKEDAIAVFITCYSISASFSFIGCLIHAGQFTTSQLSISFYFGLIPGLLLLLLILLAILIEVVKKNGWLCKKYCNLDCTCWEENHWIGPSRSRQSATQPSENKREVSGGELNDGQVFTVTPSHGQASGQPPAYNEVPSFKNKVKRPKV